MRGDETRRDAPYIIKRSSCIQETAAWRDWPLTWLTNHRPSVLGHCWLGHVTCKTVSEMTYNVSSGTLNSTIPYLQLLCSWILKSHTHTHKYDATMTGVRMSAL